MAHLELDYDTPSDTRLAVVSENEEMPPTWDVYLDGVRFKKGLPGNMVLPHLVTLFFVRSCEALKKHLLFHAAVIEKGGRAGVFPGETGSGKTTLAAALVAEGYRYFSDELAVLNVDSLRVLPLPLPMSVKPESVRPLSHYYPGLRKCATHLRTDGKKVRYLPPSATAFAGIDDDPAPIDFLVFPRYTKGAENRLVELDRLGGLQRLAKTGSSNRDLTTRDVEAMLSLLERIPCYELVFSELSQAILLLEENVLGLLSQN